LKYYKSRKGTAEVIGTTFFLVILLVFLANTLWYNQITFEMNNHLSQKINSPVELEKTEDELTLRVRTRGVYDVELKGLWIIDTDQNIHNYVNEETLQTLVRTSTDPINPLYITAGSYVDIDISDYVTGFSGSRTYKVLTDIGNMDSIKITYARAQIQSFSLSGDDLTINVKNVGEGAVNFDITGNSVVYINEVLMPCTGVVDPLLEGATMSLVVTLPIEVPHASNDEINVKVVDLEGISHSSTYIVP
jgi:hypothetical protein